MESFSNNNDQNWEEGLSPVADAIHQDINSKTGNQTNSVDNKSRLNLDFEYTSELPIPKMDAIIESLKMDSVNRMWGKTKDDIIKYHAKALGLQSICLSDEDVDDLRTRAESRVSLDRELRILHGSIMADLNIFARAYYKKKGEVKWYEYFLKGDYNYLFSSTVFDDISKDLMEENGQTYTVVKMAYRDRVKDWFLSRAEDFLNQ